jgi:hypothetical protein
MGGGESLRIQSMNLETSRFRRSLGIDNPTPSGLNLRG